MRLLPLALAAWLAAAPVLAQIMTIPGSSGGTGTVTVSGGAPVTNNCAKFTGTTAIADAGTTCGGSGSPGGSTTQLQYNNAAAFGGAGGLTTNGTNLTATGNYSGSTGEMNVSLPGGFAAGSIIFAANPTANDTITLGTTTWTFKASGATGTQTNIKASLALTLAQLVTDLNASADAQVKLAAYGPVGGATNTLNIAYSTYGTAGNAFAIGASITGGSTPSGATLANGLAYVGTACGAMVQGSGNVTPLSQADAENGSGQSIFCINGHQASNGIAFGIFQDGSPTLWATTGGNLHPTGSIDLPGGGNLWWQTSGSNAYYNGVLTAAPWAGKTGATPANTITGASDTNIQVVQLGNQDNAGTAGAVGGTTLHVFPQAIRPMSYCGGSLSGCSGGPATTQVGSPFYLLDAPGVGAALGGPIVFATAAQTAANGVENSTFIPAMTILGSPGTTVAGQVQFAAAPQFSTITGSTQCLQVNTSGNVAGSGVACGGSGGTPAGSTGDLQTNGGGGAFAAITPGTGVATALAAVSSGSGGICLTTSCAMTTPNIGAATGTSLSVSGALTSTVATGTAPLVVNSTTVVGNLNVSKLLGNTWASPQAIGTGTPQTGAFSGLTLTNLTGTAQCLQVNTSGVVSGFGTTCDSKFAVVAASVVALNSFGGL